jgi:hypothetical protein
MPFDYYSLPDLTVFNRIKAERDNWYLPMDIRPHLTIAALQKQVYRTARQRGWTGKNFRRVR